MLAEPSCAAHRPRLATAACAGHAIAKVSPLSGATIGVLATLPWCVAEIAMRPTAQAPALVAAALLLGASMGGLLGLATSWIADARLLAALLLLPAPLLNLDTLQATVERALELTLDRAAKGPQITAFIGSAVIAALCGLGARLGYSTAARITTRKYAPAAAGLAAVLGLLPLLAGLFEARKLVFVLLAAPLAWVVLGPGQRAASGVLAAGAGLVATVMYAAYISLGMVVCSIAVGSSLVVVRRVWGARRLRSPAFIDRGFPVVVLLTCIGVGGHALLGNVHGWTFGPTGGVATFLVRLGQGVSDLDGDGFGAMFGRADCAPLDDAVSPGRHEIAGNGVDDDCRDGDGPEDALRWTRREEAVNAVPPHAFQGDVVLYSVDTLRADDAYDAGSFPAMGALAADGIAFDRAYSSSTFTSQALLGHLAARLPGSIPMLHFSLISAVPERPARGLAHRLGELGYDTAVVVNDRGTRYFARDSFGAGFRSSNVLGAESTPEQLADAAVAAWNELDPSRRRFLWVHDLSVHDAPHDRASYRRAIAAADGALDSIRDRIGKSALWIFTADHGEEFGEHGGRLHARTLFEEVVRVPLVIAWPEGPRGRVGAVSATRSIMPTLLAMLAPKSAPPGRGPYLCLGQPDCRDMPVPMALELPHAHLHGLVLGRRKVVRDVLAERLVAYDIEADPAEGRPLDPVPADLARALSDWEQNAFGATADEHFWPYAPGAGSRAANP